VDDRARTVDPQPVGQRAFGRQPRPFGQRAGQDLARAAARRAGGRSARRCRGRSPASGPSHSSSRPIQFDALPANPPIGSAHDGALIGWFISPAWTERSPAFPASLAEECFASQRRGRRTAMMLDVSTSHLATNGKPRPSPTRSETDEWIDALDGVISPKAPQRASERSSKRLTRARAHARRRHSDHADDAVRQHDSGRRAAALSGRSRHRRAAAPLLALERDGDGRAREQTLRRSWAATSRRSRRRRR
jgi:hypothetical protein